MPKLTEQLAAPLRQMQVRRAQNTHSNICGCTQQIVLQFVKRGRLLLCRSSGVRQADRQGFSRCQAGGWRGDVPGPVQAPPDGRGVRLGQRRHLCADLQDDGRVWRSALPFRFTTMTSLRASSETSLPLWLDPFGFQTALFWFLKQFHEGRLTSSLIKPHR